MIRECGEMAGASMGDLGVSVACSDDWLFLPLLQNVVLGRMTKN